MNQLKGTTERNSSAAQVSTFNMVCLQYHLEQSNKNLKTNTIDCRCRKCYLADVFNLQLTIIKIGKESQLSEMTTQSSWIHLRFTIYKTCI